MKKVKALYVGVDGKPVKVWSADLGIIDQELFEYAVINLIEAVSKHG